MKLYMSLHAEAEPLGPPEKDAARKVVDIGHQDVARVTEFAKSRITEPPSTIYHAHTVRARETAEGFAKQISATNGVVETDGLMADDDISDWLKKIRDADEDLWVVGHMQNLKRIAGELLAGDANVHAVRFKRGGIACLERHDDDSWGVTWMVGPNVL